MASAQNSFITQTQYDTLVRDISVLFLYQPTITLIAKDETINKIITDDLDIIYTYELANVPKDTKIDDFLIAYRTLSGVTYKPQKLTTKQVDDVDDKITVIKFFIKNTLNSDWETILGSFKGQIKLDDTLLAPTTETPKQTTTETVEPISTGTNAKAAGEYSNQRPFNSEDFMRQNNVNVDQIADSLIYNYATRLYQSDVMKNKFYRYDSKPAVFVWAKWIYIIFGMLFALSYLASQIIAFANNETYFLFAAFETGDTMTSADFVSRSSYYFGTDYFSLILAIIVIPMLVFSLYGQVKNNKNDNVKYSCKVGITLFMLMFFLLSVLIPVFQNSISPLNWMGKLNDFKDIPAGTLTVSPPSGSPEQFSINNAATYSGMYALSIFYILGIVTLGINVVMAVAIKVIRPKDDFDRIRACIQKYVDDIKAGRIVMDSTTGTPGVGSFFGGGRNPFSPF